MFKGDDDTLIPGEREGNGGVGSVLGIDESGRGGAVPRRLVVKYAGRLEDDDAVPVVLIRDFARCFIVDDNVVLWCRFVAAPDGVDAAVIRLKR